MFEASTTVHLGNGWSALFWCDRWLDGSSIQSMAPNLCNTVRVGTRARRLVYDALQNERWIRDIKGALDMAALEQYVMLCTPLQEVHLNDSMADHFIWKWSSNQRYFSRSAYRAFFNDQCGMPGANVLRKTLALLDRCWTGVRLLRHHMRDDDSCGLCSQVDESIDHLRLGCCFTREVWSCLLVGSGLQQLCSSPDDRIVDWWVSCRKKLPKCSRGGFDSMVVLVWWLVWRERNNSLQWSDATGSYSRELD
jgi:hypothetical protein